MKKSKPVFWWCVKQGGRLLHGGARKTKGEITKVFNLNGRTIVKVRVEEVEDER